MKFTRAAENEIVIKRKKVNWLYLLYVSLESERILRRFIGDLNIQLSLLENDIRRLIKSSDRIQPEALE